jgi:hypothetical protein
MMLAEANGTVRLSPRHTQGQFARTSGRKSVYPRFLQIV